MGCYNADLKRERHKKKEKHERTESMSGNSDKGYNFDDVTGRIIGAAIEVHKTLGPGFQEVIYQRALAIELEAAGLDFQREPDVPIYYKGVELGVRRVDFIVLDCMVETKAKSAFLPEDFVQALNYVKAARFRLGLLLNFGAKQLEIKRLVNDKLK
jgi:GxxExxY protein